MVHVLLDLVFVLVWRSNEFAHGLFKNEFSIPCNFMVFLDILLIGFQKQVFWSLVSPL